MEPNRMSQLAARVIGTLIAILLLLLAIVWLLSGGDFVVESHAPTGEPAVAVLAHHPMPRLRGIVPTYPHPSIPESDLYLRYDNGSNGNNLDDSMQVLYNFCGVGEVPLHPFCLSPEYPATVREPSTRQGSTR